MCKIAIIDTGIDIGNKYLPYKHIDGISIRKTANEENKSYSITSYIEDPIGKNLYSFDDLSEYIVPDEQRRFIIPA